MIKHLYVFRIKYLSLLFVCYCFDFVLSLSCILFYLSVITVLDITEGRAKNEYANEIRSYILSLAKNIGDKEYADAKKVTMIHLFDFVLVFRYLLSIIFRFYSDSINNANYLFE